MKAGVVIGGLMCLVGWAGHARAQTEEGPKTQEIRAVERGFFFEADGGFSVFVNKIEDRSYGFAPQVGFAFGYDILPIFNLGIGVEAIAAGVSAGPDTPLPAGDLLFLSPFVRAQFAVLTTERNFVWIRGEAGFGFALPGQINDVDYGGNGPMFGGFIGFERFAVLRHFSFGAHAGVRVVTKPGVGIGISLLPFVKYTF